MTHEGNTQVKETTVVSLIQKYKAFKMKDDEYVETIFSRFQMIVAGLKVLDKGYSISYHIKKIIRSLPKKWRPMVTALKLSKDLNNASDKCQFVVLLYSCMVGALTNKDDKNHQFASLEELISYLRSHEIELQEDEPQRKGKSIALKSRSEKIKAFQAEKEDLEESEDDSDEDELSLISIILNHIWKYRKSKFRRSRRSKDRIGSSSSQKKADGNKVIWYECKELGHYKNECPKLRKYKKPKKVFEAEKGLMATWDDSDSEEEDFKEEQANVAPMDEANTSEVISESELTTDDESDSDDEQKVFSSLSRTKLESCFSKICKRYSFLISKYKILKKNFVVTTEKPTEYEQDKFEKKFALEKLNLALKSKVSKLKEEIISIASVTEEVIRYDKAFQHFLAKIIDKSKMTSMFYDVSKNGGRGLRYLGPPKKLDETEFVIPKSLSE
ncbi:uncharacterized protein LOC131650702 [Vicia villosa]|uniref:uncharacterized protein LOC131650702 n=1 Tax=Vicia villosa TaxID=3911 RepID=UPI00273AFA1D|nr:uncharacterized protein LOC131650702 [Vicia villosa]